MKLDRRLENTSTHVDYAPYYLTVWNTPRALIAVCGDAGEQTQDLDGSTPHSSVSFFKTRWELEPWRKQIKARCWERSIHIRVTALAWEPGDCKRLASKSPLPMFGCLLHQVIMSQSWIRGHRCKTGQIAKLLQNDTWITWTSWRVLS